MSERAPAEAPAAAPSAACIPAYVMAAPKPQDVIDLFRGEWVCALPPRARVDAGTYPAFKDARITWGIAELGGAGGRTVLELGPLEAGHTYLLERLGAAEIVAIEANTRAYLRCLVVKEILGLVRAKFLCGEFVSYLRMSDRRFDLAVASGVLYHVRNPLELISLLARAADRLLLWTHYWDARLVGRRPYLARRFRSTVPLRYDGLTATAYRYEYDDYLMLSSFCGGTDSAGAWLTRDDILGCLDRVGLSRQRIAFDEPDHPNGPAFAVAASRPGPLARLRGRRRRSA